MARQPSEVETPATNGDVMGDMWPPETNEQRSGRMWRDISASGVEVTNDNRDELVQTWHDERQW